VLGRDAQVGGEAELTTPTESHSVDRGDDDRVVRPPPRTEPRVDGPQGVVATAAADGFDVGPGHERLVTRAGDDEDPGPGASNRFERVVEFVHRLRVEGVAHFGDG
jgi:hypothetical protein